MSVAPGGALSAARISVAVDAPSGWRPARWVVPLFGLAALLLVPWIVLLVFALPSTQRAAHWDIAWAGFDVALALLLFTVAVAAWRRSPWLEGAATAAATLLFVDAWFDVLTSSTQTEFWVSILEAALVELPLAILCLLVARAVERRVARSGRQTTEADRDHDRDQRLVRSRDRIEALGATIVLPSPSVRRRRSSG